MQYETCSLTFQQDHGTINTGMHAAFHLEALGTCIGSLFGIAMGKHTVFRLHYPVFDQQQLFVRSAP